MRTKTKQRRNKTKPAPVTTHKRVDLYKGLTDSTHGGHARYEQRVRGVIRMIRLQVLGPPPRGL